VQLAAGADTKLGEDLAQVVLDGVRADEQPGADLRVGQAVAGQLRDPGLLGSQLLAELGGRLSGAPAGGFPGGHQLAAGPFGERFHAYLGEHVVGGAQLLACVEPTVLAAQPLAEQQVGAGEIRAEPGAAEPLDSLPVQILGGLALGEQRA
jgi:hypothetical protein